MKPAPHPRNLFLAIRHQNVDEVARLLGLGADPNWETRGNDETALAFAARVSTPDVVRVLLAHGATDHGQMPLVNAVTWNRLDDSGDPSAIARLLLQHGGNVNHSDGEGWTPLMEAAAASDISTLQLYLDHGANVHAKSRQGSTASSVALYNGNHKAADLLQDAEKNACMASDDTKSAL